MSYEAPQADDPDKLARQQYADELAGLPAGRVENMRDILAAELPVPLDPENPLHRDLQNRFLGAVAALGAQSLPVESITKGSSDKPDHMPPDAYAIRVDGKIDRVNAAGQDQIAKGGIPDPGNVVASYPVTAKTAEPIAEPLSGFAAPMPTKKPRRQIIVDN